MEVRMMGRQEIGRRTVGLRMKKEKNDYRSFPILRYATMRAPPPSILQVAMLLPPLFLLLTFPLPHVVVAAQSAVARGSFSRTTPALATSRAISGGRSSSRPPRRLWGRPSSLLRSPPPAEGDDGSLRQSKFEEETAVEPSALRSLKFATLEASSEPQLLADFLMEIGACSASLTDHDKDTPLEEPVFREPGSDNDDYEIWPPPAVICGDAAVGKNVWRRCDVTAHFPASFDLRGVVDMVRESGFEIPEDQELISVGDVPDRDWVIHVQSSWEPIAVSGFVLRFPWHTDEDVAKTAAAAAADGVSRGGEDEGVGGDPPPAPVEIRLEGGVAFGTGEHPTTRLCLGFLRDAVLVSGARKVLDYGAGSGVLGLAACALSRDVTAVGVEIDVDAVRIADYNAGTNGLRMKSYLPPARLLGEDGADSESASVIMKGLVRAEAQETLPEEWDGPVFDACAANILAGPLISLVGTISGLIRPGGRIGLSGILASQAERVVGAYEEYFDDVEVVGEEGGWVLITGTMAAK